jgi:photosystem II stability/assembly factor-like uncharacterized protein
MKKIFTTALFIMLTGVLTLFAQERIYTPALSLPVNQATGQMPNVLLDWDAVTGGNTGIINYEVQLAEEPTFANPVIFQTEFVSAVQTSELKFGNVYYWRVRAMDGVDVSEWSETWSFRVLNKITLTKPIDFSEQTTNPKLEWAAVTGISTYDYQLDTTYYWRIATPVTSGILNSVDVVDDTHAWAVGAGGVVLFFDGTSWAVQESNTTSDLYTVSFIDSSNGIAVGKGGVIIHFDGTSWSVQTSGTTLDLNGLSFIDATTAWAVGKSGVVLFHNGINWAQLFTASKDLYDVYFLGAGNGWASGKGGLVIHYDGNSWTQLETGTTKDLNSIWFTDPDNGWAIGKGGFVIHYTGGVWTPYPINLTTKDLYTLCFTDASNGWAVGKTGTLLQYDGIQWTVPSSGTDITLNGISFSGSSTGWIVGESGLLLRYNTDAFSSPLAVIHEIPGTKSNQQLNDMLFGTKYFWRVRAKHPSDISDWSAARSFKTVATVTLDKPNDGSTDENLDVLLKWKKASDNVVYEAEIDEDPNFSLPVSLSTEAIEINAMGLKFGILYNWRVRAMHSLDTSAWSTAWKFTTSCTITLTDPANGATDIKTTPILQWDPFTGIEQYNVQVDKNNSFAVPVLNDIIAATSSSYSVPVVLEKNTQYFWRVRAVNGLDTSCWSPTWAFTTIPPVGIDEPGNDLQFSVYPNPVVNQLWIEVSKPGNDPVRVTIHDILGKTLVEQDMRFTNVIKTNSLDLSNMANGIYMIRLNQGDQSFTKKLVINK